MTTDLERVLEDIKIQKEINGLAANDINMANNGFIFGKGDLDFYLEPNLLDEKLKIAIRIIKEKQGV